MISLFSLQEESKNFVTMENLEVKIKEALNNEVSYNYAMSTQGDILKGPPEQPPLPSFVSQSAQTDSPSDSVEEHSHH